MTKPRLARRNHGKGHSYRIDGEKAVGVTTALNAISKPALVDWAARVTAEYAVDNWDELHPLPVAQRLTKLKDARWNTVKEAAVRGTRIHDLGEKVSHGVEVEVPDELRGPVEAYARFLDEWQIEMVATETPVCNTQYKYAGTADGWAHIGRTGQDVLMDIKTGKGVYSEAALQLAAYRYADLWQPDGPDSETERGPVEAVYVAHILPDTVRLLPVVAGPDEWRTFLYALALHRHQELTKEDPLIGEAVFPEAFAS
ncbi:hypothetical protein ABZX12_18490 [Kribbella sp. NPDC003505]|uniref:hypothetical protein n=1 Tax=Kribbella sp. NPDC003505 TaxID=3154448 RepID=UPI0033BE62CC